MTSYEQQQQQQPESDEDVQSTVLTAADSAVSSSESLSRDSNLTELNTEHFQAAVAVQTNSDEVRSLFSQNSVTKIAVITNLQ